MRVAVVGTSGSGKTTMARRIAGAFDLPFIELDAINWQAGWRDLAATNPDEFLSRVDEATKGERWVADGNYGPVRPLIWSRATHLVWLDYDRWRIMWRVIWRSVLRVVDRRELWEGTGNRERWSQWFQPSHPIRWAWSTFKRRRTQYEAVLKELSLAHLTVIRLRQPREARLVLARLGAPDGHR